MSRTRHKWAEALALFWAREWPEASLAQLWESLPEDGLEIQDADGRRWIVTREEDTDDPGSERLFAYPLDPLVERGPTERGMERYFSDAKNRPADKPILRERVLAEG